MLEFKYLKELKYKLYEYESNYNDDLYYKYVTTFFITSLPDNFNVRNRNIIYYGAPGTGKSYNVDKIIGNLDSHNFERITFHPEYDKCIILANITWLIVYYEIMKCQLVQQHSLKIYVRSWEHLEKRHY